MSEVKLSGREQTSIGSNEIADSLSRDGRRSDSTDEAATVLKSLADAALEYYEPNFFVNCFDL